MKLILKHARLVDETIKDIVIDGHTIIDVLEGYEGEGHIIDLRGEVYVSGGWIDLHTHAFPKFPPYFAQPDVIGYQSGVTTVVDAGSSGCDDIADFYRIAKASKTRVLAFLNISKIGLRRIDELADLTNVQHEPLRQAYEKYAPFLVGLKARISASVVKENGIKPLQVARIFADELQLPIMVHVGSEPPLITDILDELQEGDILTHCFNGKKNNIFLNEEKPVQQLYDALKRGVLLDIGHGRESFSFETARKAKAANIPFHTISTDIYEGNRVNGPVYSMASVLTKFLYLGYDLQTIMKAVTETPAEIIKQEKLGKVEKGYIADLTLFTVEKEKVTLVDSTGETVEYDRKIVPKSVVLGGEYIGIE
ncbi:amidohydrolase/deacetylase family metallohydrolase [Priestia taiwanensis]|uniref:Dihydroorotase n=1 Tax=Priestia taiwanensis TaxID=1347902 RepID=A0A917AVW9_9BACI|nr:amidohydrolase/deacetylase family metallohydrolase [Priestia taiwanensis]MBM7364500.1 dihydroorotase [Priestia taiwanensis]GGE81015.1 dihydroorotase [Priestia taiwanensis]